VPSISLCHTTREGSNALSLDPTVPLPLQDLIFLHKDDALLAWHLANDGKHPVDLMVLELHLKEAGDDRSTPEPIGGKHPLFDCNLGGHSRQVEDIVGGIQLDDVNDADDHIVVRNRRIRQQSGERWDEIEDMDNDEDDEGAHSEEDDSAEDVVERECELQMPQERQTIVIDVSLLCFSYLEEYQTQ